MMKTRKILAVFLAVAMIASLAACGSSDSETAETEAAVEEVAEEEIADAEESADAEEIAEEAEETEAAEMTTLKFGCYSYSTSLDPSNNINSAWCNVRYGIGECLFKFDDTMTAQPCIADSYEVNDEHTEWVFHIRDGVKFSNGTDVTAEAVLASLEREFENNADAVSYFSYSSMTADEEAGTVTINTTETYADLCGILAYPYFTILNVEETTDFAENPIGTGPYYITTFDTASYIYLDANPYYWNGEVPFENLEIYFIEDASTKAMALETGDVDVVENVTNVADIAALKDDPDYNLSEAAGVRVGYCHINLNGVLGNDALRKAIMLALDDETMCESTMGGLYTAGYSVLPSSLDYGYDSLTDPTPYDVEAAEALLDEAGIVDTDGDGYREIDGEMVEINYVTYDSRNLNDFAEAIQIQLDRIGIKVDVNATTYDTGIELRNAGEFDLCSSNELSVPTGDPQTFLRYWYSGSDVNWSGYSSETYDALYEQLLSEMDPDARRDLLIDMQQLLMDDCVVLVHGYYNSNMASSTAVTGANIYTADYYWITTDIKPAE